MKLGDEYKHKTHGRVILIAPHPHDGAYLICEKLEGDDDKYPELFGCESSDLEEIPCHTQG